MASWAWTTPTNPSLELSPFFDNLKNQGAIYEPVFAFYLSNKSKMDHPFLQISFKMLSVEWKL